MNPIDAPVLDLIPALPEMIIGGVALALLVFEAVYRREDHRLGAVVALLALAAAAWASMSLWSRDGDTFVLGGMIAADRFAVFFRLLVIAITAVAVGYSWHHFERTPEDFRDEYFPLLLIASSGMTMLVASANLILVFLSLEVLSLSLYILTGFSVSRFASREASMKYFLLGAFSSAFLLYGIAMAYGATGTTSLPGISASLSARTEAPALALVAMALLVVGLGFKVAAVPFHQWTPDVYQGAPTPVTAFMSAGTKVAGFAALLRVFMAAFHPLQWEWVPLLWGVAAITMVVGSVLAIAQSDIKRLFAYSSIAHAGFILVGVVAASPDGLSGSMFYLVAYAAMILGAFGVVLIVSGRGDDRTGLSAYAGLAERSPVLAAVLSLFLLSLAGIPPTAGFIAKVSVFTAAVRAGHWPLALVAVLASVIAAYFYIRVIVLMYMEPPEESARLPASPAAGIALAPAALVTLGLGVFPSVLFEVLRTASVLQL